LKAEYFQDANLSGEPKIVRIDKAIDFYWERSPINQKVDESFGVKWSGILKPEKSGTYQFNGNVQLKLDGKLVGDKDIQLEKGKQYQLEATLSVAAFWWASNHQQQFATLGWVNTSRDFKTEAIEAEKKADKIVCSRRPSCRRRAECWLRRHALIADRAPVIPAFRSA